MPELVCPVAQRQSVIGRDNLPVLPDRTEDHKVGASALRTNLRHFRRTEATREGELRIIVHLLVTKDENRMFFKSRAHRRIHGSIGYDLRNLHAEQFDGEPWSEWYDVHRPLFPPQ